MDQHHKHGVIITVLAVLAVTGIIFVVSQVGPGERYEGLFDGVPVLEDLFPSSQQAFTPEVIIEKENTDEEVLEEGEVINITEKEELEEDTPEEIVIRIDDGKSFSEEGADVKVETTNATTNSAIEKFYDLDFSSANTLFSSVQDDDPVALFYLGLISSYEDNDALARSFFKKVINESRDVKLQSYAEEVLSAYKTFDVFRDAKVDFLYALLGKAYINVGQPTLGILKLKQATAINENYNDAWVLLGTAYILSENYEAAEKALRNVNATTRPEPSYYLGLAAFNQGNFNEAIIAYRQAIDLGYQPVASVYTKIAESFLAMERYADALKSYMAVVNKEPQVPEHYSQPIWINLTILNKPDAAFRLAQDALEENPRSAFAHNLIAWVALEKNDLKTTKQYLDAALTLDPQLQAIYYNYGRYYQTISDVISSKSYYRKAIAIDPKSSIAKLSARAIADIN